MIFSLVLIKLFSIIGKIWSCEWPRNRKDFFCFGEEHDTASARSCLIIGVELVIEMSEFKLSWSKGLLKDFEIYFMVFFNSLTYMYLLLDLLLQDTFLKALSQLFFPCFVLLPSSLDNTSLLVVLQLQMSIYVFEWYFIIKLFSQSTYLVIEIQTRKLDHFHNITFELYFLIHQKCSSILMKLQEVLLVFLCCIKLLLSNNI